MGTQPAPPQVSVLPGQRSWCVETSQADSAGSIPITAPIHPAKTVVTAVGPDSIVRRQPRQGENHTPMSRPRCQTVAVSRPQLG
jgi:hypothetical protein